MFCDFTKTIVSLYKFSLCVIFKMSTNQKKFDKAVKAVTILATKLYIKRRGCDMLDVIEEAMDLLQYEGDACLDDIAVSIHQHLDAKKHKDYDVEKEQLKEAQRHMNILAKGTNFTHPEFDEENWNPSPPAINNDWLKTLDVLDALHFRQQDLLQESN